MSSIVSPFGGQGIKQFSGFGGNGGGFGQQGMNQPNQFGPQSGGFGGGFGGGQQSGGFGGNQQGGGFGGMGGGFGGQQGFGGGFGQQQQQFNPYQQQQQFNPYQQQQQYNPYQQQQYNPYQQQQQYNPYQQQPQQYNPFPYQQPPQQQQFNPYQQQFNPYQQFGYGQRQQMENPYQRQQQQFMNRGQDRGGFDDRATGFDGASITDYGRGGLPPDPAGKASIQDMMNSIVGLGSDPDNKAGYTMQDIQNAQRNQQTSSNTMLDGSRPPQLPMKPPFNPYQQFNYGGGSDPRGRGGYKNDRRFGGRLPQSAIDDPVASYTSPRPDLPDVATPQAPDMNYNI